MYKIYLYTYAFEDDKKDEILKKKTFTYHQSCQNPRWPPIMVKELFLV